MGVVHHTHYFTWFEVGRTELMRERGRAYAEMEKEGIFMPVVEASCSYLSPARYDDELEVETAIAAATRVRVEFAYRIRRPADGRLLASGRTVHVATGSDGVPRRLAAGTLEALRPAAPGGEEVIE
jgi:acyl-CoA thioester hydrolase